MTSDSFAWRGLLFHWERTITTTADWYCATARCGHLTIWFYARPSLSGTWECWIQYDRQSTTIERGADRTAALDAALGNLRARLNEAVAMLSEIAETP